MDNLINDKLFSNIVQFVVIGLLGWLSITTFELSSETKVMAAEVRFLTQSLDRMAQTQFTDSEAVALEQRVSRLEEWDQNLSTRISKLETDIRNSLSDR